MSVPYQCDNPTDQQRYEMFGYALSQDRRREDLENVKELLSPPVDITTICPKGYGKDTKVAIMGGGEAGLAAAFELRKIGCNITIFEASNRIGGRINTYYFDKNKRYFGELGAMRIPVSHETSWHYINLFNLKTSPFVANNVRSLFYLRDKRAVNDPFGISIMKNIYPRYNLDPVEASTPWRGLAAKVTDKYLVSLSPEERKELLQIKPTYSRSIQERDMLNRMMAYERAGLSRHAIAMLGYIFLLEQNLFKLGFIDELQELYTEDFVFTYYVLGGMINLPMSFYMALTDEIDNVYKVSKNELGKVAFKMECPVDGIYESPDGDGVILGYRDSAYLDCSFEKFDYVVCTIPFSSLRRVKIKPLFSVMKNFAIADLNYEDAQKTFLFLSDRFWEYGIPCMRIVGGTTFTDLPAVTVFYPSDHSMPIPNVLDGWTLRPGARPDEPGVLLSSYNWTMDATRLGNEYNELRINDVKGYIERIHGLPYGYINGRLISYKTILWSEVQYIWGGAAISKPEDKILYSYVVTLPEMNNKVFFAGEHISQKHAWQQGSLQTGMIAANQVAEKIKLMRS